MSEYNREIPRPTTEEITASRRMSDWAGLMLNFHEGAIEVGADGNRRLVMTNVGLRMIQHNTPKTEVVITEHTNEGRHPTVRLTIQEDARTFFITQASHLEPTDEAYVIADITKTITSEGTKPEDLIGRPHNASVIEVDKMLRHFAPLLPAKNEAFEVQKSSSTRRWIGRLLGRKQ